MESQEVDSAEGIFLIVFEKEILYNLKQGM